MAEKGAEESAKASPSSGEKQLPRRKQELDYWKRNAARLRTRNLATGLLIGAFAVGMCILQWGKVTNKYCTEVQLRST